MITEKLPPDLTLSSEQITDAVLDYLWKHNLIPKGFDTTRFSFVTTRDTHFVELWFENEKEETTAGPFMIHETEKKGEGK